MKKTLLIIPATIGLTALGASAATLTLGTRSLVSTNNANFDISVFDGSAAYNDRGVGGVEPGTGPFTTTVLGDGTVTDYNFVHSPGGLITSYASKGTRISAVTSPAANTSTPGENWSNVWTTGPIDTDLTTKDFSNVAVPNTFARSANASGSINISGLASGDIYIPHGTFNNGFTLSLTMTGPGQTDLIAIDTLANGQLGNVNNGWITDFTFDNAGDLYDTISFEYTNLDADGSRARFMGVILDGQPIPEPSAIALLGLAGLGLLRRRR